MLQSDLQENVTDSKEVESSSNKKINSKCIGDQDWLIQSSRKSVSHLQESVHEYDQSCPTRPSIKLDSRVQFKESGCDQISSLITMKNETKSDGTQSCLI